MAAAQPTHRRRARARWLAGGAIVAVVIVVVSLVVIRLTTSSAGGNPGGTGRHPAAAPAVDVRAVTTVPPEVFDEIGTDGQPEPFAVTRGQPALSKRGLPRFVYEGGEYCPYCAMMRYALIAALSRFGTFSHLKAITSGGVDPQGGEDGLVPTFSFLGASYSSRYLVFTPYELWDREEPPKRLQRPSALAAHLFATYDGSLSGQGTKYSPAGSGIPFLDIADRYVSSGDPVAFSPLWQPGGPLHDGGPGRQAIAAAIHDPTSAVGRAIKAPLFIAEANYLSAAMCSVDGEQPSSVCTSRGVRAAAREIARAAPVG